MPQLHLYLKNIPATDREPFQVKMGDTTIFSSTTDITSPVHKQVQVEQPEHASFHKIYLNILIPMCDIDELNQYNLTEHGYHFEISTTNLKIKVRQNHTGDFSQQDTAKSLDDNNKFEVDEKTGEFVYKKNKPVYLREGYEKKESAKKVESEDTSDPQQTRVWFHLSGIQASEDDPFVLSVGTNVVFKYSKPIGKRQQFPVYIKRQTTTGPHEIDLHISMPELGLESDQHFNLTNNGVQIMIAVIGNGKSIQILQEKDRDRLPNYDSEYAMTTTTPQKPQQQQTQKPATSQQQTGLRSTGKGFPHKIAFYSNNIPASNQEPYRISVNDQILFESKKNIGQKEFHPVVCEIDPPASGDLIIQVRFQITSRAVDFEQSFNITKNGPFVLLQIVTEGEDERVAMKQQHKDIWGNALASVQSSQQQLRPNVDVVETVYFYLSNLPASNTKPVELLVNGVAIFQCSEDLSTPDQKDRIAIVTGRVPKPRSDEHIVAFTVRAPLLTRDEKNVELNLASGKHIKITMQNNQLQVLQSTSDKFDDVAEQPKQTQARDYLQELEQLASLRDAGILTQQEFDEKKKRILNL